MKWGTVRRWLGQKYEGVPEWSVSEAATLCQALKKFNGHELEGRALSVEPAKPKGLGESTRSGLDQRRSRR